MDLVKLFKFLKHECNTSEDLTIQSTSAVSYYTCCCFKKNLNFFFKFWRAFFRFFARKKNYFKMAPAETKRQDYLSWDDYFMGVAFLSAMRSKDPRTQVGAW